MHVARYHEPPGRIDFCPDSKDDKDPVGAVHRCIHAVAHMIEMMRRKPTFLCGLLQQS